jgi:hypothetical protein
VPPSGTDERTLCRWIRAAAKSARDGQEVARPALTRHDHPVQFRGAQRFSSGCPGLADWHLRWVNLDNVTTSWSRDQDAGFVRWHPRLAKVIIRVITLGAFVALIVGVVRSVPSGSEAIGRWRLVKSSPGAANVVIVYYHGDCDKITAPDVKRNESTVTIAVHITVAAEWCDGAARASLPRAAVLGGSSIGSFVGSAAQAVIVTAWPTWLRPPFRRISAKLETWRIRHISGGQMQSDVRSVRPGITIPAKGWATTFVVILTWESERTTLQVTKSLGGPSWVWFLQVACE